MFTTGAFFSAMNHATLRLGDAERGSLDGGWATVHLISADPIVGTISIPGQCAANWNETHRISATNRLVSAHVASGPCGDNTWNVTIQPTSSLTGADNVHAGTTFSFTPA
jgi:hypothetical protein